MNDWPEIYLDFGNNTVQFNWKMDEIDEDMPGKLKNLRVHGENIADWNVLMKGLQPEEERRIQAEGEEKRKEYTIQNDYGIRARIKMFDDMPAHVSFELTVLI
ncbi:Protein CBG20211 [Caenorhabditis briggsae]|uniref:Protein CBG20211 n=1 Tax=Caenorhabditis briggsae TaxID=6238 RepID=A8XX67_CAEBR|nr:Protein CBG20211 [Caenorhabditis briggsae]CAP37236.1 Protein CBG20211 [Caenorhabditis briggsae]